MYSFVIFTFIFKTVSSSETQCSQTYNSHLSALRLLNYSNVSLCLVSRFFFRRAQIFSHSVILIMFYLILSSLLSRHFVCVGVYDNKITLMTCLEFVYLQFQSSRCLPMSISLHNYYSTPEDSLDKQDMVSIQGRN